MVIGLEVIFIKMLSGREKPLGLVLVNNLIGTAIASAIVVFVWIAPTGPQWVAMVGVGVFMVCGQGLFVNALARSDSSFAAPFSYATLLFATALDLTVYNVWPDAPSLMGAGFRRKRKT